LTFIDEPEAGLTKHPVTRMKAFVHATCHVMGSVVPADRFM